MENEDIIRSKKYSIGKSPYPENSDLDADNPSEILSFTEYRHIYKKFGTRRETPSQRMKRYEDTLLPPVVEISIGLAVHSPSFGVMKKEEEFALHEMVLKDILAQGRGDLVRMKLKLQLYAHKFNSHRKELGSFYAKPSMMYNDVIVPYIQQLTLVLMNKGRNKRLVIKEMTRINNTLIRQWEQNFTILHLFSHQSKLYLMQMDALTIFENNMADFYTINSRYMSFLGGYTAGKEIVHKKLGGRRHGRVKFANSKIKNEYEEPNNSGMLKCDAYWYNQSKISEDICNDDEGFTINLV